MKNFDIFLIFAQNIDCGYTLEPPCRGGSNECPQSIFWNKNKKNRYTPAYSSFAILKWGSRGYTLHGHVFLMEQNECWVDNYSCKVIKHAFVAHFNSICIMEHTIDIDDFMAYSFLCPAS